ncbi:MAG: fibronectin type III domain-containing protein [Gammaproteobacteria bacterium]
MNDYFPAPLHVLTGNSNRIAAWLLLSGLLSTTNCFAGQVSLRWDASPSAVVSGYKVYYGLASRNYTVSVDVGNTLQYTATGLQPGLTYYFTVTAYINSTGQESGFSNEAIKTIEPSAILLQDGFD